MGEDFCVFNPVFIPSRLPFEIILLILDRLSDSDKLSLRILDKEWNSIFHGHLDSKLYHNISIRHTGRSYRLLRELSLDPVLSKHVQSIAHSSCTLPLQTEIIEFFDTYLTAAGFFDRQDGSWDSRFYSEAPDAFDEYVRLYAAQDTFLAHAHEKLAAILQNFENLLSVCVTEDLDFPAHHPGSSFEYEGFQTVFLDDLDLSIWMDSGLAPAGAAYERNVMTSSHMIMGLAGAGCRIKHFHILGHICSLETPSFLTENGISKALASCELITLGYAGTDFDGTYSREPLDRTQNLLAQILRRNPPLLRALRVDMKYKNQFRPEGPDTIYAESTHINIEEMNIMFPPDACEAVRNTLKILQLSGFQIWRHVLYGLVARLGLECLQVREVVLDFCTWEQGWPWLLEALEERDVRLQQLGPLYQRVDSGNGGGLGVVYSCSLDDEKGAVMLPRVHTHESAPGAPVDHASGSLSMLTEN